MALDIERPAELIGWLRRVGLVEAAGRTPVVRRLAGGVSNRAMVVGDRWVVKQALDRLRVPVEWNCSPERIHREAAGLRWVAELCGASAVPALVFEDQAEHVIVMAYVSEPHDNFKALLLAGRIEKTHVRQFGELLGCLHTESSARLDEIRGELGDRSFFESLRLEPYYAFSAERVPEAAEFLGSLIAETRAIAACAVHGDYSPKNVLVHDGRLILLDHEVMHVGDPAFDIGFSLAHLLSKAHALPSCRRELGVAAIDYWRAYAASADATPALESRAVRHGLGCLLARVAGRSPLEYLDEAQRARQRQAALTLMTRPPERVEDLAGAWLELLA